MPLDPRIGAMLDTVADAPPVSSLSPVAARAMMLERAMLKPPVPTPGVTSEDISFDAGTHAIPARLYRPEWTPMALILFFHGSGFVIFDIDTHDELCRHLCARAGCAVLSVDYRLAPENKFPAAVEDCVHVTMSVQEGALGGLEHLPLILIGDSAGANLATVTALHMRDHDLPLVGQILIYPVIDHYAASRKSYVDNAAGYGMSATDMRWFWDHYLNTPDDAKDWRAVPILADPTRLPPTLIITAEYDVLRDEAIAYAQHLHSHGVDVEMSHYMDMNHGFVRSIGVLEAAEKCIDDCAEWLKRKVKL